MDRGCGWTCWPFWELHICRRNLRGHIINMGKFLDEEWQGPAPHHNVLRGCWWQERHVDIVDLCKCSLGHVLSISVFENAATLWLSNLFRTLEDFTEIGHCLTLEDDVYGFLEHERGKWRTCAGLGPAEEINNNKMCTFDRETCSHQPNNHPLQPSPNSSQFIIMIRLHTIRDVTLHTHTDGD